MTIYPTDRKGILTPRLRGLESPYDTVQSRPCVPTSQASRKPTNALIGRHTDRVPIPNSTDLHIPDKPEAGKIKSCLQVVNNWMSFVKYRGIPQACAEDMPRKALAGLLSVL